MARFVWGYFAMSVPAPAAALLLLSSSFGVAVVQASSFGSGGEPVRVADRDPEQRLCLR